MLFRSGIGQDALKQHGQLGHGFVAVVFCQFHHAVLHDVQGSLVVPHLKEAALESPLFDAGKKVVQFFFSGHRDVGLFVSRMGRELCHC